MILGYDHLYVTVSNFARSEAFYDRVMQALEFRKGDKEVGGDPHAHYFNPHLQYTIRPARSAAKHDPYAPGLHHVCFQVAGKADVDEAEAALNAIGVEVTAAREYEYGEGYYAIFFEDPDGIRLEVVARTPNRRRIHDDWDRFRSFLNPVAALDEEERR
jgi:catechol 2,3-dioxygenase-like lactoylglutathione lyase family enzyme